MKKEILNGELMNEEQLNAVVGGTRGELSCDTKLLYALGLMPNFHEPGFCGSHAEEVAREIGRAVEKTGRLEMNVSYSSNGSNKYHVKESLPDGGWASHFVTRAEAYRLICKAAGQPDFDYEKYM